VAELRTKLNLVNIIRDALRTGVAALDYEIEEIANGGFASEDRIAYELLEQIAVIEAVSRVTINDPDLLREIFRLKRILAGGCSLSDSREMQPSNANKIKEVRRKLTASDKRISKFAVAIPMTGQFDPR